MYSGKTNADKTHDIATAVLPKVMEQCDIPFVIKDSSGSLRPNVVDIVDLYNELCDGIYYERIEKYLNKKNED